MMTKTETRQNTMTAELKECPFCGGEAELYVYSTGRDKKLYLVRCENCGNGTCADDNVYTVLKLWNVRLSNETDDTVIPIYISLPYELNLNEKYTLQKKLSEAASDYLNATVELREPCIEDGSNDFEVLASSVKSIGEAEYVIFLDCWEANKKCRVEYSIAKEYGKKILIKHANKLQEVL